VMDMAAQKSDLAERVRRLVDSGLCTAESASEYVKELRQLVKSKMDEQSVKRQSRIFKALSDPTRLKIIELLSVRDMCVCEIMAALDMTQPTASHHLNILESTGLLSDRREGKWVFYALANPKILSAISKIPSLSTRS
jgi:DNA-binding transcriptional ArsR family regulator